NPTFHRDIAPIVFAQCAPCHRPGEAGPFPLLTYEDARKRAPQIAAVTRKRYMPPWLPAPGFGEFAGEHRLSETQIETIENGVQPGAPEARPPALTSPSFRPGWQPGPPDLVLAAAKPFMLPADGPDVFWNFILPGSLKESRQVRAIEIRPGNARTVHHANV